MQGQETTKLDSWWTVMDMVWYTCMLQVPSVEVGPEISRWTCHE